jgi:hypothetical protein
MATFVKTDSGTWKAIIRKQGWPITSKTFRTKRDATDWARSAEDEMVRGVYISRAGAERLTVKEAVQRYLNEVTPTKKPTTQRSEKITAEHLSSFLGKYSMAALSSDLVASYRDHRISAGKSNNTVRIELALLSNLFTIAIQEWGLGLTHNPVAAIRKPSPGKGRDRRLNADEEERLLEAVEQYSNLFFIAWENNDTGAMVVNPITRFGLDELDELGAAEAWTVRCVLPDLAESIQFREIDSVELSEAYRQMAGRAIAQPVSPATQAP